MLGRTDRRSRLVVLLIAFVVMAGAAVRAPLRTGRLPAAPSCGPRRWRQLERTTEDTPLRGDILDRNGGVLATTVVPGPAVRVSAGRSRQATRSSRPSRAWRASSSWIDAARETLRAQLEGDDPYVVHPRDA